MKKTLSVFICLILAVTVLLPAKTAKAATNCFSIPVSGTQFGSIAGNALNMINTARSTNSLDAITADTELEDFAQSRAAQVMLGGEKGINEKGEYYENCSDLTPMSFIFPDYGDSVFSVYGKDNDITAERLYSRLSSLCSGDGADKIKSAGIAVFRMENVTAYYCIFSYDEATQAYTGFKDSSYRSNVNVHYKYIPYFNYYADFINKKYFELSVEGLFTGLYNNYLSIPNSQLIYQSTNPGVFKIKGNRGYIKNTGKYSVNLLDKNSTALCKFENLTVTINRTAPKIKVRSPRKKTLRVKWNIYKDSSGYEIQYSRKKNMKRAKTIRVKNPKTTRKIIKKLKRKKRYYVRVRAYMDQGDGEVVYSNWSKRKFTRIK